MRTSRTDFYLQMYEAMPFLSEAAQKQIMRIYCAAVDDAYDRGRRDALQLLADGRLTNQ